MMTRHEYFNELLEAFTAYIESTDMDEENAIEEEILAFIEDHEVPDESVGNS